MQPLPLLAPTIRHPDYAWKAVREITLPGAGSLFIKTHPTSPWIWVDMTLNSDPQLARTICVVAKAEPSKPYKCWEVADYGRATHFEYNRQGSEIWVSVWGAQISRVKLVRLSFMMTAHFRKRLAYPI